LRTIQDLGLPYLCPSRGLPRPPVGEMSGRGLGMEGQGCFDHVRPAQCMDRADQRQKRERVASAVAEVRDCGACFETEFTPAGQRQPCSALPDPDPSADQGRFRCPRVRGYWRAGGNREDGRSLAARLRHRGGAEYTFNERTRKNTQMKTLFYQLGFVLYKMLIRPFKRTPVRWSAIIFNEAGQFAIQRNDQGGHLPSGDVRPGFPIPDLCRQGLGLDRTQFIDAAPLRVVGIVGRGGEGVTIYYSGELTSHSVLDRPGWDVSFVERSELSSLVPAEVENSLD